MNAAPKAKRKNAARDCAHCGQKDAEEANNIIVQIAEGKQSRVPLIIKSKSMTAEEIQLNHALEDAGMVVDETDLGEWIIQLRHEGLVAHMVMPAIHLPRLPGRG